MYFDTHAHYDSSQFDNDRDEVLKRLPQSGVRLVLNPGCDKETSEHAVRLADEYSYIYAAVGWHPHEASTMGDDGADFIREMAKHPRVMAIGEIGLDYHYDYSPREVQREKFRLQMELARELDMPVIIHDREAHEDVMNIIRDFSDVRGVFHCYSGSAEMARDILKLGWYISFTGNITFKNARKNLETIALMPNDKIMLETDAPYQTPVPHRGKRNDSAFLPYMAEVVAEIKGMTKEEAAKMTAENGKRFFGIE